MSLRQVEQNLDWEPGWSLEWYGLVIFDLDLFSFSLCWAEET